MKQKTTRQLISEFEKLAVKARKNLRRAEQLVSECWDILSHSK